MQKNTLSERGSPTRYRNAQDLDRSTRREPERLAPAAALIIILMLSLGLWWALWLAVSCLASRLG